MFVDDVVITQNTWVGAPVAIAGRVLERILDRDPDIVALQEWPSGRNPLLKDTGRFHRLPGTRRAVRRALGRTWEPSEGMTWCRPILGPTGPVGAIANRYELLGCRAVTLTGRRRVVPTKRHPRKTLPANRVTLSIWCDHDLDEEVAVIGYHLTSGIQKGKAYSKDPDDRARVDNHRDQVAALEQLIAEQLAKGRTVYAEGDSNFDGLQLAGVTSAWAGRGHEQRGTHLNSSRKIDDVHGPGHAAHVFLINHPEPQIDHQGVVAVRRRDTKETR